MVHTRVQAKQQLAEAQASADDCRRQLGQVQQQSAGQQAALRERAGSILDALKHLTRLTLRCTAAMQAAAAAVQAAADQTRHQQPVSGCSIAVGCIAGGAQMRRAGLCSAGPPQTSLKCRWQISLRWSSGVSCRRSALRQLHAWWTCPLQKCRMCWAAPCSQPRGCSRPPCSWPSRAWTPSPSCRRR